MVFCCAGNAEPVDEDMIRVVAQNWLAERTGEIREVASVEPGSARTNPVKSSATGEGNPCLYVAHMAPSGFVIVTGDDFARAVVCYSPSDTFSWDNLPPAFKAMLESGDQKITAFAEEVVASKKSADIGPDWERLLKETSEEAATQGVQKEEKSGVKLPMTTLWDQGDPFNASCPSNSDYDDGHPPVGCVAVALAQIMRYNEYPPNGSGIAEYTHSTYGTLTRNLSQSSYAWDNMPDYPWTASPDIASMLYDIGVAVHMNYGAGYDFWGDLEMSGARNGDAVSALRNHFGYPDASRQSKGFFETTSSWIGILKRDLEAYYPVYYSGGGLLGGGHAFVLYGFDDQDYFWINWGASGSYQSTAYSLDSLTPGDYQFSYRQEAIVGIRSPSWAPDSCEPNNSYIDAYNFGSISAPVFRYHLNVNVGDIDWFRFTTLQVGDQGDYVRISFLNDQGDLDLELYKTVSGGISRITGSAGTGNEETISLSGLASGTYYVVVTGYNSATNPDYTLEIDPPASGDLPGSHLSIDTQHIVWDDDNGNDDGIPVLGETAELHVPLIASADCSGVRAILTVSPSYAANVTDNESWYWNIASGRSVTGTEMEFDVLRAGTVTCYLHVTYMCNGGYYETDLSFNHTFPDTDPQFSFQVVGSDYVMRAGYDYDPNGILQSGECGYYRMQLRNTTTAFPVTGVEAAIVLKDLPAVRIENGRIDYENFGDMGANVSAWPESAEYGHWRVSSDYDYAGTFKADVYIIYDGRPETDPLILEDAVEITISPLAWFWLYDDVDFGFIRQKETYVLETNVHNRGTASLNVNDITFLNLPAGVQVAVTPPLPWGALAPGASQEISISVTPSAFRGQLWPPLEVIFDTDACFGTYIDSPDDDRILISGLVSAAGPVFEASNPAIEASVRRPDVGGNVIVWCDNRNGNNDIFALNLSTQEETQITNDPARQDMPRVSGNLIAWNDTRNQIGIQYSADIYAYDLSTGQEFVVSNASQCDYLVGVDGDKVAFASTYHVCYDYDGRETNIYNLFLYEYAGSGQGTTTQLTFFAPGAEYADKYSMS